MITAAGAGEVCSTFAALDTDRSLRIVDYPSVDDRRLIGSDGRAAIGVVFGPSSAPTSSAETSDASIQQAINSCHMMEEEYW